MTIWIMEVSRLVQTACDEGIDFFDHADIYGGGKSEEVFGKVEFYRAAENRLP